MGMLSRTEIEKMGFRHVGSDVLLSEKASFYNCKNISIGDHSRIDDFCILSAGDGGIEIGRYVHIAVYSSLIGAGKITFQDYCNVSSRVSVYSSNDDYSGLSMTNPTVAKKFTNVQNEAVFVCPHVIIGSGAVILPGVRLERGVAVGALSLVTNDCQEFGIYAGIPVKFIKPRSRELLEIEQQFLKENQVITK